jgi:hypothetical protein
VSAALLAVDASKAYHCVDRRKLRAAVEAKFPFDVHYYENADKV